MMAAAFLCRCRALGSTPANSRIVCKGIVVARRAASTLSRTSGRASGPTYDWTMRAPSRCAMYTYSLLPVLRMMMLMQSLL